MASKNRAKGDWKDGRTGTDCRNVEGEGAVDVNREMRAPTCSAKPSFPAGFFIQTWPGGSWLVGGS